MGNYYMSNTCSIIVELTYWYVLMASLNDTNV